MPMTRVPPPRGAVFDYGGTLVDEVLYDPEAGLDAVLAHATTPVVGVRLEQVRARAARVARDVAARREEHHVETPWISMARLVHEPFGTTFSESWSALELVYWNAAVRTEPTPGIHAALHACRAAGVRLAVLSNSSFGSPVITHELAKHGLDRFFEFVMVTADYAVRKPNPLVFDVAVARLGVPASDVWFIGDRLDTDVAGARAAGITAAWYGRGMASDEGGADLALPDWNTLATLVSADRSDAS